MKHNKYKILVLSDLKKSAELELTSTVGLAKMIDSEITLLHVKKPTEIVERESQLSAMRAINEEHIMTNKRISNLIQPISDAFQVSIHHELAIGNIKNEIEAFIIKYKPDLVVLGKRKYNAFSFIGDNIIDFVLKIHKGSIMIAAEEHALQPNKEVFLGVLNTNEKTSNTDFINVLINKTTQPIRSFKISKTATNHLKNENDVESKNVEYVFEHSESALDKVSKYASINKINLMCFDNSKDERDIKNTINKLNVSLLLIGQQKPLLKSSIYKQQIK